MKKIKFLAMLLMVSLLLVACGQKTDTTTDKTEDTKTAESTDTTDTTDTEKTDDKDADCCDDATLNGVTEENPLKVDKDAKSVTIYTKYNGKFETEATRHLAIFKDGKLSDMSIFSSYVSPEDFYNALEEVGAEAGNNMNADNAATTTSEGSQLDLTLAWAGQEGTVGIDDVVKDSNGKALDVRFSGNLDNAKEFNTGCITCLDSCFVGITSNGEYPLGAIEETKEVSFSVDADKAPEDGTPVAITYTVK
ncbi:YdjY domain-containing protein [uncultured Fenollaria sp.]|uniref:YdjY domain-containing protein n=1 Tax=uncultured Fenollaria sp. TaxID=1686315 RepID=UPI0025F5C226|nr:YdjY domain-containing protein [uncultured Fenollaria sp.]